MLLDFWELEGVDTGARQLRSGWLVKRAARLLSKRVS